MKTYHAYQIYDTQDGAMMYVDEDAAGVLREMAKDLEVISSSGGRIETVEVGTVSAVNPDEALDKIRAGSWASISSADGCS